MSNNKGDQKLETNMQIPEHFTELSIRLSEALDDIGAGKDTIMERRETFLWRERMAMIGKQLLGINVECFHFGSQSEGTTTPGLQSDIDFLISNKKVNILRVWGDWKAGMMNHLMLHDDITPSQQYLLQVIRQDTPEPETSLWGDVSVRKDSGQVLLSAEKYKQDIEYRSRKLGEPTKNGPSVSVVPNWDFVYAFHILKPLPEIQHWIDRCRGRHWPPVQLLDAAQVAPSFLVPAGHPDSDYNREEWRLSPNLIERMLMFSFNMVQIKCYIVLKLIKKALFSKIVGDSITSFHSKTIMFYTIERTHPSLWLEHNLMFLLRLCLHVLRKWLQLGRLPHYIIEGVNLFDGKLSNVQQRRLLLYIDSMIRNNLQDVFYIGIDNIGCQLQACNIRRIAKAGELGRECLRKSISLLLKFEALKEFCGRLRELLYDVLKFECFQNLLMRLRLVLYELRSSNTTFQQDIQYALRNVIDYSTNVRLKNVALEFLKQLYGFQNSIQSSKCLRLRNVLDSESICRFKYYSNTDVASSSLKLASTLYCSGYLHAAVRVLEDVERRYHSKVKAVCGCNRIPGDCNLEMFANMISGNCDNRFGELPFAFCVTFFGKESYCTPFILLFEMNRNITEEEITQRTYCQKQWMKNAEVDARPFLHYLQYLTYGGLGERDDQLCALRALKSYLFDIGHKYNHYHGETSINLLGHCFEMEGEYERALQYYKASLRHSGKNNAANWHVRRVLSLISG